MKTIVRQKREAEHDRTEPVRPSRARAIRGTPLSTLGCVVREAPGPGARTLGRVTVEKPARGTRAFGRVVREAPGPGATVLGRVPREGVRAD